MGEKPSASFLWEASALCQMRVLPSIPALSMEARALSRLCRGGYYQEIKHGKEKLFINKGLLEIFLRVDSLKQKNFGSK